MTGTGRYVRLYGTARGTQWGYSLWEFEVFGKKHVSCATPTALSVTDISENAASLHWQATGATKFNVQYKTVSAGSWTTTTSATNALTLTGLACATDYLSSKSKVFVTQPIQATTPASTSLSTSTCTSPCSPLPTRWTTLDIGEVGVSGSACYNDGVFELQGSGDDIGNTQDAFRFAFKTLVGGGEITARITSLDQVNAWNKCGIMFRESLTPGSRYAFIALTSGNGVTFQNRIVTDGVSNDENTVAGINAPVWVKLVKNGSVYTAYHSADGIGWTKVGNSIDAGFGVDVPVYAGLALTSHDNAVLSNARVDNYLFRHF